MFQGQKVKWCMNKNHFKDHLTSICKVSSAGKNFGLLNQWFVSSMTSGGKFIFARKFFKAFGVNIVRSGQLRLICEKLEWWRNFSLLTFTEVGETLPRRPSRGTA